MVEKSYRAYAGVGSRETPRELAPVFADYARRLRTVGYVLRSGRATGADSFFEAGAGPDAELFLASGTPGTTPAGARTYVPSGKILDLCSLVASVVHPAWNRCGEYARLLHSRNVCQIHGENLDSPVDFVVAWARSDHNENISGGTRLAWDVACAAGIRCFNLAVPASKSAFEAFLSNLETKT